jgi:inhibitor of KinA sporulation pathway (predicted exonuclease)
MVVLAIEPDPALKTWPKAGEAVVFDVEYTAWEGSMARAWSEPWEYREIIHIGAVRLDTANGFRETGSFEVLVRPVLNRSLSDYVSRLTGITDARLAESGWSFAEALGRFVDFIGNLRPLLVNGLDGVVLRENCRLNALDDPLGRGRVFNLRPALARTMGCDERVLVSSDLPGLLGLPPPARRHSGLADARAIATALRELRRRGAL